MSKLPNPASQARTYRIGELSRASGIRVENIRYYERVGLMPEVRRTVSNYRLYTNAELKCLAFIQRCRSLDMSLDEIRRLILLRETPIQSCQDVDHLLDEHIAYVGRRITSLQELRQELKGLRSRCRPLRADRHCAILNELSRGNSGVQRSHQPHATLQKDRRSC